MQQKILIVDDDESIVKLLVHKFKKYEKDFSVQSAHSGATALEIIKKESPNLAIIDYVMPEMSGSELVEEIRKLGINIPIIMLTVKRDRSDVISVAKSVDDYILKPFDANEVMMRTSRLLLRYKDMLIQKLERKLIEQIMCEKSTDK